MRKILVVVVLVLGIAVLAGGVTSIVIGRANAGDVTNSNAADARLAVDTLIKHRQSIAPTYSDLLGGKHFDPTNPTQLTYAQGMNLQNAMTTAVLAYGLTTVLTVVGSLLLVVGIAIILVGVVFWWQPKAASA
jgi:Flp pilus assembly protein TadB